VDAVCAASPPLAEVRRLAAGFRYGRAGDALLRRRVLAA